MSGPVRNYAIELVGRRSVATDAAAIALAVAAATDPDGDPVGDPGTDGDWVLSSVTPAQLTGDTDDWDVGDQDATVIRASTDASWDLTGLLAPVDPVLRIITNIGAQPLVLKHDTTSAAANRFLCPSGADVTLAADAAVFLAYDDVTERWRVVGGTGGGAGVTYGTPAVVLGTAAAAGAIDEAIRRDATIVAFDATAPSTQAFGDAAAVGVAAKAPRRDHKHAMPALGTGAADAAAGDHTHTGTVANLLYAVHQLR